ncbi:IQ domain-containing protein C [Rhynochetos jubatus]
MAAALWPQAEAEGWRRLLRAVTRLQAHVRGYLLRKRFRGLRAEYEAVVRELEGDLGRLEWTGRFLPRPLFAPQPPLGGFLRGEAQPPVTVPVTPAGLAAGHPRSRVVRNGRKATPRSGQAAPSAGKPQEEPDGGCGSAKPPAPPPGEEELSSAGEGDVANPQNLGAGKGGGGPAESEARRNGGCRSRAGAEPLEARLDIPLEDIKDLPRTRSGLQSYRNHLIMELLWLQQAIVSRKNYLMLKQRLGPPDP